MFARPVYRWKSFWFGVLVLAFLGWMWVRSMALVDSFFRVGDRSSIGAAQEGGWLRLEWYEGGSSQWGTAVKSFFYTMPSKGLSFHGEEARWFQEPWMAVLSSEVEGVEGRMLLVAHWVLVVAFLVPWVAFLSWWRWRMKRLAAGTAELPARGCI